MNTNFFLLSLLNFCVMFNFPLNLFNIMGRWGNKKSTSKSLRDALGKK